MSASPPTAPQDGSEPRSRLDRELDEILSQNDNIRLLPNPPRVKPQRKRPALPTLPPNLARFVMTPMVSALLIALLAYLVRDVSRLFASVLCFLAVACIIWPVIQRTRQPRQVPGSKTWRGQTFDVGRTEQSSPVDSLRNWWNSQKR